MRTSRLPLLAAPCPVCGSRMPETFHSSCRRRASWTPKQRGRFDAQDDSAFAFEIPVFVADEVRASVALDGDTHCVDED